MYYKRAEHVVSPAGRQEGLGDQFAAAKAQQCCEHIWKFDCRRFFARSCSKSMKSNTLADQTGRPLTGVTLACDIRSSVVAGLRSTFK